MFRAMHKTFAVISLMVTMTILLTGIQCYVLRDIDLLFNCGILSRFTVEQTYGALLMFELLRLRKKIPRRKKKKKPEQSPEEEDAAFDRELGEAATDKLRSALEFLAAWGIGWAFAYLVHNTFF